MPKNIKEWIYFIFLYLLILLMLAALAVITFAPLAYANTPVKDVPYWVIWLTK